MAGYKSFGTEVLTAADVNDYLMRQTVIRVANSEQLAAIPTPEAGMMAYRVDDATTYRHDGTAWRVWHFDSGWQAVTLLSGYVAGPQAPQARRIGSVVYTRGGIRRSAGVFPNTYTECGDLPAGMATPTFVRIPSVSYASGTANGALVQIEAGTRRIKGASVGPGTDTLYLDGVTYLFD